MSEPASTAEDPRLAARSKALVVAAFKVFATRGYHASGVADIVKEAGVSHGTFYNYFDNKRHILDAVLDFGVDLLIDSVVGEDRPGDATTAEEFGEQFRAILGRVFDVLEREPKLVEFVVMEAPAIDAALVHRLLELFGRFATLTNEFLRSGVERGFLRDDFDPRITSEALLSLIFSVVLLAVRGPVSAADRDRHIAALADFAFAGVRA